LKAVLGAADEIPLHRSCPIYPFYFEPCSCFQWPTAFPRPGPFALVPVSSAAFLDSVQPLADGRRDLTSFVPFGSFDRPSPDICTLLSLTTHLGP
jgi:hypothetical protein